MFSSIPKLLLISFFLFSVKTLLAVNNFNDVTVSDYAQFLNATAKEDPHALYDQKMGEECGITLIQQVGEPGNYSYHFQEDQANEPMLFVDVRSAMRFCNWKENGEQEDPTTTEHGVYELDGDRLLSINIDEQTNYFLPKENDEISSEAHPCLKLGSLEDPASWIRSNQIVFHLKGRLENMAASFAQEPPTSWWEDAEYVARAVATIAAVAGYFKCTRSSCNPGREEYKERGSDSKGPADNNVSSPTISASSLAETKEQCSNEEIVPIQEKKVSDSKAPENNNVSSNIPTSPAETKKYTRRSCNPGREGDKQIPNAHFQENQANEPMRFCNSKENGEQEDPTNTEHGVYELDGDRLPAKTEKQSLKTKKQCFEEAIAAYLAKCKEGSCYPGNTQIPDAHFPKEKGSDESNLNRGNSSRLKAPENNNVSSPTILAAPAEEKKQRFRKEVDDYIKNEIFLRNRMVDCVLFKTNERFHQIFKNKFEKIFQYQQKTKELEELMEAHAKTLEDDIGEPTTPTIPNGLRNVIGDPLDMEHKRIMAAAKKYCADFDVSWEKALGATKTQHRFFTTLQEKENWIKDLPRVVDEKVKIVEKIVEKELDGFSEIRKIL